MSFHVIAKSAVVGVGKSKLAIVKVAGVDTDLFLRVPKGVPRLSPEVIDVLRGFKNHYALWRPSSDGTLLLNPFTTCRAESRLLKIPPFSFHKLENTQFRTHWIANINIEAKFQPQCLVTPGVQWPADCVELQPLSLQIQRNILKNFFPHHGSTIEELLLQHSEVLQLADYFVSCGLLPPF